MTKQCKTGCAYGTHRVVEPGGVLPQAAWKVDNSPEIHDNEILIDVETLNVDAASFKQIVSGCDPETGACGINSHGYCKQARKDAQSCYRFRWDVARENP